MNFIEEYKYIYTKLGRFVKKTFLSTFKVHYIGFFRCYKDYQ